jgi:type I restriction enzyme S subunit
MSDKWIEISKTFEKVIDHRGKTPKKLGGDWSDKGYRALSALQVKTHGLENLNSVKYLDRVLYRMWMKEEIENGDLLLTSEAPAGQVMVWNSDEKIVLSQRLFGLRINKKYNNYFIKYFIQSNVGQSEIFRNTSGSTVSGISAKMFDIIMIPDFEKQRQDMIAAVLKSIDDKIELNNKINVELELMTKTLYDYWFVQFDFPDANGKPYKSSGSAMVYNEKLKRKIPKDWKALTIESIILISKNGDWGEDEPSQNLMKVYCVRGADINALNGQSANLEPPVRHIRKDHHERLLKPDDLMVEISGGSPTQSTGRIAHIGETIFSRFESPLVCSNFCKAISLKDKAHSYILKHYWNKLYESEVFFNFEGKTSGIKNLMFDRVIQDVYLAMPSDNDLVTQFHEICQRNDELIQTRLLENQKLAELRDWLLPMLMNGQVTIK